MTLEELRRHRPEILRIADIRVFGSVALGAWPLITVRCISTLFRGDGV